MGVLHQMTHLLAGAADDGAKPTVAVRGSRHAVVARHKGWRRCMGGPFRSSHHLRSTKAATYTLSIQVMQADMPADNAPHKAASLVVAVNTSTQSSSLS